MRVYTGADIERELYWIWDDQRTTINGYLIANGLTLAGLKRHRKHQKPKQEQKELLSRLYATITLRLRQAELIEEAEKLSIPNSDSAGLREVYNSFDKDVTAITRLLQEDHKLSLECIVEKLKRFQRKTNKKVILAA